MNSRLSNVNFKFNSAGMKTVTMQQFRKDATSVLRRVARWERFVLSHRGKPAARLEPLQTTGTANSIADPFLAISRRATSSPKGKTKHAKIDQILFGRR